MTQPQFAIDDFLAIQRLVHLYPRRLDTGDLEGLGMLFEHATVHFETLDAPLINDPAGITAMFADFVRMYDGKPRTRHLICNLIIEEATGISASAGSTVLVVQDAPGVPLQPIITGDYRDRFAKVDGIWRFAERWITNDLFGDLSAHGKYAISGA